MEDSLHILMRSIQVQRLIGLNFVLERLDSCRLGHSSSSPQRLSSEWAKSALSSHEYIPTWQRKLTGIRGQLGCRLYALILLDPRIPSRAALLLRLTQGEALQQVLTEVAAFRCIVRSSGAGRRETKAS